MQQTATKSKAADSVSKFLGWLHHNLLFIKDYATGEVIFRAETEVRLTDENQKQFERLMALLQQGPGPTEAKEMESILHQMVDAGPPTGPGTEEGKRRAKAIFSAALGLLRSA